MGMGMIDRAFVTDSGNHVVLASMGGSIWMDAREAGFGAVFNSPAEYVMTNSISTRDTDDFPLVADYLVRESGKVTLYAMNHDGIAQAVKVLDDPARIIFSLAFSPGGDLLAVGYHDGTLKLFDTQNGALLQTIAAHNDNLTSLAFSPDGRQVITESWSFDGFTYVWNTITGAKVATLSTASFEPGVVSFSMDSFQASATSSDGTHIFSTRTWTEAGPVVQGVWEGKISCDDRMLMVPSGNGMDFYSLATGQLLGSLSAGPMYCLHSGELVAFEYDESRTKVQMVEYNP